MIFKSIEDRISVQNNSSSNSVSSNIKFEQLSVIVADHFIFLLFTSIYSCNKFLRYIYKY